MDAISGSKITTVNNQLTCNRLGMHVSSNMTNDDPSQASGGLITCHKPILASRTGQSQ